MSSRNSSRRSEVKLPASKLCQAISNRQSVASREGFVPGEIVEGKRNRNQKKSYVVDSSDDEDEDAQGEEDEDAEGDDDDVVEMGEDDVEGEIVVDDTMDIDADGDEDDLVDEDAEGEDDDMVDLPPPQPTIKVSKPTKSTPQKKIPVKSGSKAVVQAKDSDDEELSELESEEEEIHDTVKVGGMGAALGDDDAEGEEDDDIEAAGAGEEEEDDDLESDDDTPGGGSRAETPDLTKMTKRQRARFEDGDGQLMKLSDEVQAKKHFTAEELSMRRSEMARRRRNLSDKRNEEVKMETINKLLKKQAPKISRKAQLAADEATDAESQKPNPVFVRWISTKEGNRVAVPDEMLAGPTGKVFIAGGLKSGKMVEEVS